MNRGVLRSRSGQSAVAVIALVVVASIVDLAVRGTSVTPDSISYLSMARGIRSLEFSHWSGEPTGLWPYGYPVLLSVLGDDLRTAISHGFVVQTTVLSGVAVYALAIARWFSVGRRPVFFFGAAWLMASPALLFAAQWLLTELTFLLCWLAFLYHVVLRCLVSMVPSRRVDLAAGVLAAFLLPNIRYIGVAGALGVVLAVAILGRLGDPDWRSLWRRGLPAVVAGLAGLGLAAAMNLASAHSLFGVRLPQHNLVRNVYGHSLASIWQVFAGSDRLPFRFEIAAGTVAGVALAVSAVLLARAAWVPGGWAYRRLTVGIIGSHAVYLAILYVSASTTLVDALSPRFFLPLLPGSAVWLIAGYVVVAEGGRPRPLLIWSRSAGGLALALCLVSFACSLTGDLAESQRRGDLASIDLGPGDLACLRAVGDVPARFRISNNAALVWLISGGTLTALQASYLTVAPPVFTFIDTGTAAVGSQALLVGTHGRAVCSGTHLTVEERTADGGG